MSEQKETHDLENVTVTEDQEPAPLREKIILFLVMAAVIIADQLTKNAVESQYSVGESWAPLPEIADFLRITRVNNTGAAFGIFPSGSLVFMVVGVVVAAVIILYNRRLPKNHVWYRVALGLQLGGALGNLIDRFRQGGHVTDFIDVGPVPVFNIADASIVTGVILLLFLMLMDERKEKASVESLEQPPALAENTSGESPEDQPILWKE